MNYWRVGVALAVFAVAPAAMAVSPYGDLVSGKMTCADLDSALAAHDDKFFDGWTDKDFEQVRGYTDPRITTVCRQRNKWSGVLPTIGAVSESQAHRKRLALLDEQHERTRIRNADAQATHAQLAAQAAIADGARRQALATCQKTPASRVFVASEKLVRDAEEKRRAEADLAREKRVGEVSGTVDMAALHRDGEKIVALEDDMAAAWLEYKQQGGKAANPSEIVVADKDNPCP